MSRAGESRSGSLTILASNCAVRKEANSKLETKNEVLTDLMLDLGKSGWARAVVHATPIERSNKVCVSRCVLISYI